ncbi:MAG: beta-galactosidase [Catenulispora sp.]|nr:beta-galactosidase [Catenulispora sp.]
MPLFRSAGPHRLPRLDALVYGGDYNPEQWPEDIWAEDVALMRQAGVNLVSLGVFSWALLEPEPGVFDFGWLDRVFDLLAAGGIAVALATPTAAPPPWFARANPDSLPVTRDGRRLGAGSRQAICPSSPAFAEAAVRIAGKLAERYGHRDNLMLWHVFNEYMAPTGECYCEQSVQHFRHWLRDRYTNLDSLNEAWGTTFWGQRYGDWDEIDAPRTAPSAVNPAQRLDFARFTDAAWLECFRRERDAIRTHSPDIPVTTNFQDARCKGLNQWAWAAEVDVVSNGHYLVAEENENHIGLALAADLTRGVAAGGSWLLMEHSTSAVNWQERNIAKRPGEMARNSLAHFARGADGIMFFQWRASRFGQEKFHSAMLPHGGTDTRIWREVVELGATLAVLGEARGAQVAGDVAVVWDWESWWALELDWRPSADVRYVDQVRRWYEQLWRSHLTVDFVAPEAELGRYPLVVVPSLYLTTEAAAKNLRGYVEAGGTLVVSFFSGIVDENDAVVPGAVPGALRDLLGITIEEFLPLRAGERVTVAAVESGPGPGWSGTIWTDDLRLREAEPFAVYEDGPAAGKPAVTRNRVGAGTAWYVSTALDGPGLKALLDRIGAARPAFAGLPETVEVVRRVGAGAEYVTVINHGEHEATLPIAGVELVVGAEVPELVVPGGQVRVVRRTV